MSGYLSKLKWIFVILICLLALSFTFPQEEAQAGVGSKLLEDVYNIISGSGKISDAHIESIVEDFVKDGVSAIGFDDERFKTEEEKRRYEAVFFAQQISDYLTALSKADFFDTVDLVINMPKFMKENAANAYKKVEAQLEKAGGDISKVEDASIFGIKVGDKFEKIVERLDKIRAEDYEGMRKMKEQLVREAYKALGVDGLPQNLLNEMFNLTTDEESFMKGFNEMDKADKDWLKKNKAHFAFSAHLTPEALRLLDMAGISSLEDFVTVQRKTKVKSLREFEKVAEEMAKARLELESMYKKFARPMEVGSIEGVDDRNYMGYYIDGLIHAFFGGRGSDTDFNFSPVGQRIVWSPPEKRDEFMKKLKEYEEKFGIDLLSLGGKIDEEYNFYQITKDKDEEIKLIEQGKYEYHTFISKVVFTIYKKSGNLGKIDVAPQSFLNTLAKRHSPTFASVYEKLTGNASPEPKVITRNSSKMVVELNYLEGIKNKHKSYYDVIRNNWSKIAGKHKRKSMVFDTYKDGFVPTMAFANISEEGVYVVEAIIYATRYYHRPDDYIVYTECEYEIDEKGRKVHVDHKQFKYKPYYPYRQKVKQDEYGHNYLVDDDTRNVAPDVVISDKPVGKVIWEVNVGNPPPPPPSERNTSTRFDDDNKLFRGDNSTRPDNGTPPRVDEQPENTPGGKWIPKNISIIIPAEGVENKDIYIGNFLSK